MVKELTFTEKRLQREAAEKTTKLENQESLDGVDNIAERISVLFPTAKIFDCGQSMSMDDDNVYTLRDDSDGFGIFIDAWNLSEEKPTKEQLIGVTLS